MAQTTGQTSFRNAVIEFTTDGTNYVNISGVMNKLEYSGGNRAQGEAYTGSADTPVIAVGKREPITLAMDMVYSEATADYYTTFETYYTAGTPLKIRWAPKGGATGNFRYTADTGYILSFTPPQGEYSSGDPVMISLEVLTGSYSRAAI